MFVVMMCGVVFVYFVFFVLCLYVEWVLGGVFD